LNCENCNTKLVGEYCHRCGQSGHKIQTNFTGFLNDIFTNSLGTGSGIIRSLRTLIFYPGRLTVAWIEGHRNQYTTPIQLYLFIASAFFLLNAYSPFIEFIPTDHTILSSLTGARVGTKLTETQLAHLQLSGISLEVFKERFDARVSMLLGPLLIFTVIIFSFLTALVSPRGYPFTHHAVFALHWCSIFLLIELFHRIIGGGQIGEIATAVLSISYLVLATARVYGGWVRAFLIGPILFLVFIFLVTVWMAATLWIALP